MIETITSLFTSLWFYSAILLVVIVILVVYKLKLFSNMFYKDHETDIAEKASALIQKEKELKLKEKEVHRQIELLYKDSIVVDNLREMMDKKHSTYKEYEQKVKGHHKELKDVKEVLSTVDELLEKLPEKDIEKFVKSSKFKIYKKAIEKYVK
ncbi:MAG: hypothetical protein WC471_04475 [Candidatus Woesearchaeota archaeon]